KHLLYRKCCLYLSPSVLSLCTVNCDVVYMKVGEQGKLSCKYYTEKQEVSWTFNSQLIGRESKTGASERGAAPMSSRSWFSRGSLSIKKVEESDAGKYKPPFNALQEQISNYSSLYSSCSGSAQPTGPFFLNEAVNIQCNVMDGAKVKWTCKSPSGHSHMASDSGSVKVTLVNISDGGKWECFFEENGQKPIYSLEITIIGLMPSGNVTVQEGESPILPCMVCEFPSPSDLLPGLWIWIATGVGCVVLIILVSTAVILYQKRKRIKVRDSHPLMPRDYCHCNR
uniref:Uncharacterized LOC111834622 n=1 Tax=Paramormyrops kingsleyae TaxID=1676925 RepID=A0A3B3RBZ4_9TELE